MKKYSKCPPDKAIIVLSKNKSRSERSISSEKIKPQNTGKAQEKNYKVYISEVTVKDLEDTKDETLRRKFKNLIKSFNILKSNKKIRDLANAYIERGVFPEKYVADALHVAVASFYDIS